MLAKFESRYKAFKLLDQYSHKAGADYMNIKQGSFEWHDLRRGVISASFAKNVLAGEKTETYKGYVIDLIVGIVNAQIEPEIKAKQLEWGKQNETKARALYKFETNSVIDDIPFVFKDDTFRVGFSPDACNLTQGKYAEIKCPYTTRVFLETILNGKLKPEWIKQLQFQMWVSGQDEIDYYTYDPRVIAGCQQTYLTTVEKDDKIQAQLDERIPRLISEVDEGLAKLGSKFEDKFIGEY